MCQSVCFRLKGHFKDNKTDYLKMTPHIKIRKRFAFTGQKKQLDTLSHNYDKRSRNYEIKETSVNPLSLAMMTLSQLICYYYQSITGQNIQTNNHSHYLLCHRAALLSISTLRRHLKSLGLFRQKAQSDVLDVALFLQEQLNQHRMLHGYKFMHLKCFHMLPYRCGTFSRYYEIRIS